MSLGREPETLGAKRGAGETRAMVLRLKLQGRTTREISEECGISTQAVNKHLRRLRRDGDLAEGAA